MRPVLIHRKNRHEAEQAIKDLEQRGFELVHPLTEQISGTRVFDRDKDDKHVFSHTTHGSHWAAKMQKVW